MKITRPSEENQSDLINSLTAIQAIRKKLVFFSVLHCILKELTMKNIYVVFSKQNLLEGEENERLKVKVNTNRTLSTIGPFEICPFIKITQKL